MARNFYKRLHTAKTLLIITSIIVLNLIGIGYSYWQGDLNVLINASTGYMGVVFNENVPIGEDLSVRYENNNRVMVIEGVVDMPVVDVEDAEASRTEYLNYEGSISFGIINTGTVPVKLSGKNMIQGDSANFDPVVFSEKLYPGEDALNYLEINAGEGIYDFEINLEYNN